MLNPAPAKAIRFLSEIRQVSVPYGLALDGSVRAPCGRNERSQKAIERIGAVKEGILRNHMILPDGHYRHSVFYSILDTECPDVQKWLEELMKA
jgi:hypothetical protein